MSSLVKLNEFLSNISFENDFGKNPIFIGRITQDQSVIGVGTLIAAFAFCAIGGVPLGIVILTAGFNDILASKDGQEKEPTCVDTTAEAIYDDEMSDVPGQPKREPKSQENSTQPCAESTPDVEFISIPRLPQVTDRARRELIERLREECPALLKLIKSHPIRAVGIQRTGKSTLIKKLALLRMILIAGHKVIASTPHYEPTNPYPDVFRVVGVSTDGKRDYPSIRREWSALALRVEACRINSITTIWDEFGLQDKVMEEDEIKSVLTSCLRETTKFGEYPIFIVHGETAAFLPGSKGLVSVFLNSTVRVEAVGELIEGEDGLETVRPTGKFNITWLDGSRDSGKIPDWLTEKHLLELLGNPSELLNRDLEPLNQPNDKHRTDLDDGSEPGSEPFTPLNLSKEQILALIENLNRELNQTQIIERLWQVTKGGSAAWKEAREQFRLLTGE